MTANPRRSAHVTSEVSRSSGNVSPQSGTLRGARLVLRLDGLFEGVLGALLILHSTTGFAGSIRLPYPATEPVVALSGVLLLPLLPFLWRLSRAPRRRTLAMLSAANGAGALIFTLWVLIWHGAFSTAGATLVLGVAAFLAMLAVLQAGTCEEPLA